MVEKISGHIVMKPMQVRTLRSTSKVYPTPADHWDFTEEVGFDASKKPASKQKGRHQDHSEEPVWVDYVLHVRSDSYVELDVLHNFKVLTCSFPTY